MNVLDFKFGTVEGSPDFLSPKFWQLAGWWVRSSPITKLTVGRSPSYSLLFAFLRQDTFGIASRDLKFCWSRVSVVAMVCRSRLRSTLKYLAVARHKSPLPLFLSPPKKSSSKASPQ